MKNAKRMSNGLATELKFCEKCKQAKTETMTWIDAIKGTAEEVCNDCFQIKLKGGKKQ